MDTNDLFQNADVEESPNERGADLSSAAARLTVAAHRLAVLFTEDINLPVRYRRSAEPSREVKDGPPKGKPPKIRKIKKDSLVAQRFKENVEVWRRLIETMLAEIEETQAWRFINLCPHFPHPIDRVTANKDFCDFVDYMILRRDVQHGDHDEVGSISMLLFAFQREVEGRIQTPVAHESHESIKTSDVQITGEFQKCIEAVDAGKNVFITGKAGTGKSTLLQLICKQQESKTFAVVAPTGVAALNVDGMTVHRCFAFRPGLTTELTRYRPPKHLQDLDMLVIDEVSMAKADLIDMVDLALRRAKKKKQPFGGVQLVLVGDLFQLPPVEAHDEKTDDYYATPFFFSSRAINQTSLKTVELTTVFRQKDEHFISILNAIRDGSATQPQLDALNCRHMPDIASSEGVRSITLAARNNKVQEINERQLSLLSGNEMAYQAETEGEVDTAKHRGLEELRLKPDAQVMMLVNQDGYVNGSLGKILSLTDELVTVEIEGLDFPAEIERYSWKTYRATRKNERGEKIEVGSFTQFPLKLAWAVTVHKSQGKTFDNVVFDSSYSSQDGQTYVALSRCTSLEGLTLTRPIGPQHVKVSPHVLRFHRIIQCATAPIDTFAKAFVGVVATGTDQHRKLVEVAIVRHEATKEPVVFSSLINPNRDLCDAAAAGLSASGLTLCPDISQVRKIIALMLSDAVPVGFQVHDLISLSGWSEDEVEEGVPYQLPRSDEDSVGNLKSPLTAISLAEAARDAFLAIDDEVRARIDAAPFVLKKRHFDVVTYALPRKGDALAPTGYAADILNNLDSESQATAVVGLSVGKSSERQRAELNGVIERLRVDRNDCIESAKKLYKLLVDKANHDEEITQSEADQIKGLVDTWKLSCESPKPQNNRKCVELRAGMRVCLTGKAAAESHPCHGWEKSFVKGKAEPHGLVFIDKVNKGDAPDIVALLDISQESNKAKKARKWDIPVVTWKDIVDWATDQDD
jgi:ATP-dependent DNA helicase PIF1